MSDFFYKIHKLNYLANENIYWKPINLQDPSVRVRILPTEDNIGKYPTLASFWGDDLDGEYDRVVSNGSYLAFCSVPTTGLHNFKITRGICLIISN